MILSKLRAGGIPAMVLDVDDLTELSFSPSALPLPIETWSPSMLGGLSTYVGRR
jgi:hypothetical protein